MTSNKGLTQQMSSAIAKKSVWATSAEIVRLLMCTLNSCVATHEIVSTSKAVYRRGSRRQAAMMQGGASASRIDETLTSMFQEVLYTVEEQNVCSIKVPAPG